jgi:Dockerin type I domain
VVAGIRAGNGCRIQELPTMRPSRPLAGACALLFLWFSDAHTSAWGVVIAQDSASNPAYADGWQAGDNGGYGFQPWGFDDYFDPLFSPHPTAQFIASNSYVDIPAGGPAFAETNANQPYWGYTSAAIRPFSNPLPVGGSVSIDLDNPQFHALGLYEYAGAIFQLFDDQGNEQLGLLAQAGFNSSKWAVIDADHPVDGLDTGLSWTTTKTGGFHYEMTLTDSQSYQLKLTPYAGGAGLTFTGGLLTPGNPVSEMKIVLYFNGSSTDGSREFYANHLQISVPVMADVNMDGAVNIFDINLVSAHWGEKGAPGTVAGDANKDGVVNIFDINLISANWSPPAPSTSVPEPAGVVLMLCGGPLALAALDQRRDKAPRRRTIPASGSFPL